MQRSRDVYLQGELEATSKELSRASGEVETLRTQLSTAVAESKQLKADLASLTEEAALVERKLAAEVGTKAAGTCSAEELRLVV